MSKPNGSYVDGYVTPERRVTVIPEVEFPFENYSVPDTYARILSEQYDVTPKFFVPAIATRTSWTNYALYNATFANAAWTKTNITNADNSYPNPDTGASTMASGLETATNAEHAYQQAYTFTAVPHVVSFIVVPNGRTWFRVKANDGTTDFTSFFNTTGNGVVGTQANCTGTITLIAPSTYRLTIAGFTPAAAAGNAYLNYSTDGSTVSYAGTTTLGAYVWGAGIYRASSAGPVILTTSASVTVSAPNTDPDDIFAYLVQERAPTNYTSAVAGVSRKFARVPKDQTSYPGSKYIPLPTVANSYGGDSSIPVFTYPVFSDVGVGYFDTTAAALYTDYNTSLFGPMKACGARVAGYATGGTFTLTFGASTTAALNYNDSGGTIETAINGLASVISAGLTATCTNDLEDTDGGGLIINWSAGSTLTPLTMNAGSLTVTTSQHPTTSIDSNVQQDILLPDHITITGHNFNTAVSLAAVKDNSSTPAIGILETANWGSVDSNTIWVPTASSTSTYLFAGSFKLSYGTGTYLLRTRVIESFSLPGITSGITTPADIAVPSDLQNNSTFAAALVTLTGFQTYQSEGPESWMGTLIYVLRRVEINLDDIG